jgi:hypothetical protein
MFTHLNAYQVFELKLKAVEPAAPGACAAIATLPVGDMVIRMFLRTTALTFSTNPNWI